jgi:hypothetical protein
MEAEDLHNFRNYMQIAATMLQAGRSRVRFLMSSDWPNPSSSIMALGSTQPLTEMSTRNFAEGKGRPTGKNDNLTAICELRLTRKMWEPRRLTTIWFFTACYRDSFTYFYLLLPCNQVHHNQWKINLVVGKQLPGSRKILRYWCTLF